MPVVPERAPLAEDKAAGATALLIVDMISSWDFPDCEELIPGALTIAPKIADLKRRCQAAGVPTIYANDNQGRWRSDFRHLIEQSLRADGAAAEIAHVLRPDDDDYFVLKPKHSAFFATPLDLLLRHLRASRLIVTGVSSDQCILLTAEEARMRDYEVIVPNDCIATQTPERNDRALSHLSEVLGVETAEGSALRLPSDQENSGQAAA